MYNMYLTFLVDDGDRFPAVLRKFKGSCTPKNKRMNGLPSGTECKI